MIHIDPASPQFEALPRKEQAKVYLSLGWNKQSILDEFGVTERTLTRWINPDSREKQIQHKRNWYRKYGREWQRAYRQTEAGKACVARWKEKRRAQSQPARFERGEG